MAEEYFKFLGIRVLIRKRIRHININLLLW